MILSRNTLCFYVYLFLVNKSNAEDYPAQGDRDNVCSKSVDTNLKVEQQIEVVKDSIMNAIREHKRDIHKINHEFNEKINKINGNLKDFGQFEKSGKISSSDYLNQLRKSEELLVEQNNKTKSAIYEQEIKLRNTLKSLRREIVCVEEQGFKNIIENSKLPHKVLTCGDKVFVGQKKALLQFTTNETFTNYRKCIWTLRIENYTQIRLQIQADTFTENDFLMVTDIYGSHKDVGRGSITLSSTGTVINHSNRSIFEFFGPVIFITFVTKEYNEGSGFLLKIEGIRNSTFDDFNDLIVESFHYNNSSGSIVYPLNGQYSDNLFLTMVINLPIKSGKEVTIKLEYVDIEFDVHCDGDALTIYNYDQNSNSLRYKRYCDPRKTFHNETIVSSDGAFIITFISDSSKGETYYRYTNGTGHTSNYAGFRFSWETMV